MLKKNIFRLLVIGIMSLPISVFAQVIDDLGDSASFGKEVRFFGSASTGLVLFHTTCAASDIVDYQLTVNDKCVVISPTNNSINYDLQDLGRITFPDNTFQNLIYPLTRNYNNYFLFNNTTTNKNGSFYFRPYLTLESEFLNTPGLINAQTGLPFNGKIDIFLPSKRQQLTLVPNGLYSTADPYTSYLTNGLTKKHFMDTYGLSQLLVDKIFLNKITIRLNIKGNGTFVQSGSLVYFTTRFLGN